MNVIVIIVTFLSVSQCAPLVKPRNGEIAKLNSRLAFCNTNRFDAIMKGPDDKQYFFRAHSVYIVSKNQVTSFHRHNIFPKSPYYVDGMAFSQKTGKAYLFKSRKVWVYQYRGNKFYHLLTKRLKPPIPNIIEAAFYYEGYIYLMKDGYLYGWDEQNYDIVPYQIFSTTYFWKDVPKNVQAAMQHKNSNKTVFLKWERIIKMRYYIFDNVKREMIKSGNYIFFFPFCTKED